MYLFNVILLTVSCHAKTASGICDYNNFNLATSGYLFKVFIFPTLSTAANVLECCGERKTPNVTNPITKTCNSLMAD